MKCKECKWYDSGVCHRHSPAVIAVSDENPYRVDGRLVESTTWPTVHENDWCGEHEPREEQESDLGDKPCQS